MTMGGSVTRFLLYPGCRVTVSGSAESCDRAELLLNHLGLVGNESDDKEKINRMILSYRKTAVEFPDVSYELR